MNKIAIIGAGKIGGSIAKLLAFSNDYTVTVVDQDAAALERLAKLAPVRTVLLDIKKQQELLPVATGQDALFAAT